MANCLTIAWFVAFISVFSHAEILVGPKDTEAEVGETVELHCKGTLGDVDWQHLATGKTIPELVYKDGYIYNGYNERFNVSITVDGTNVLIIRNVKPGDAGTFTCLEDTETPSQRPAELIVFERVPSNESCAGKYTCKPVCNELELSCEMKAHGHYVPSMQWTDSEGSQLDSKQIVANGITISTVKLKRDPYVAASFTCRLKYTSSSITSSFNWTYSTSATKSMESPNKTKDQPTEVPRSALITAVIVAVVITLLVTALVAIPIAIICMKRTKRKAAQKTSWHMERNESTPDAAQHLISTVIEIYTNSNKETFVPFVPCTSVNRDKAIYGLAAIDDEVFIMTKDGRVVEVFDLHKGTFKRYWTIGGLINPNDMTACPIKKIIFICDWKKAAEDKEIFCFDINGNPVSRSWVSEYEKGRISVSKKSKLIIAESWHNTIKEYTSTGALRKTIKAGKDKLHLWHAVKLNDGNFVASFGDARDGREDPQICIIDEDGQLVKSLRCDPALCLSVPRSLAVDNNGNVYVSDHYTRRITVLDSELEFKGFLDTTSDGHELSGPMRICVHEYNNESWLLVADNAKESKIWRNGRLAVWNLQSSSLKAFSEASVTFQM